MAYTYAGRVLTKDPGQNSEELHDPLHIRQQDIPQPQDGPMGDQCHLCSSPQVVIQCAACRDLHFCHDCYQVYHQHPRRRHHLTAHVNGSVQMQMGPNRRTETAMNMVPPGNQPKVWKCEHCTYENSTDQQICEICCKTPTKQRKLESSSPALKLATTSRARSIEEVAELSLSNKQTKVATSNLRSNLSQSTPKINGLDNHVVNQGALATWKCFHCTYINEASHQICQMCSKTTGNLQQISGSLNRTPVEQSRTLPRFSMPSPSSGSCQPTKVHQHNRESVSSIERHWATPGQRPFSEQWTCERCNYINSGKARICNICKKPSSKYLSLPANLASTSSSIPMKFNEKIIRRIQGENDIPTKDKAILVFQLMQRGHSEIAAVKASHECNNLEEAEYFLKDFSRKDNGSNKWETSIPPPKDYQSLPVTINGYGSINGWSDSKIEAVGHGEEQRQLRSGSNQSHKPSKEANGPVTQSSETGTQNKKTYSQILKGQYSDDTAVASKEEVDMQPLEDILNEMRIEENRNSSTLKDKIKPIKFPNEENRETKRAKESPEHLQPRNLPDGITKSEISAAKTENKKNEETRSVNKPCIVEVHTNALPEMNEPIGDNQTDEQFCGNHTSTLPRPVNNKSTTSAGNWSQSMPRKSNTQSKELNSMKEDEEEEFRKPNKLFEVQLREKRTLTKTTSGFKSWKCQSCHTSNDGATDICKTCAKSINCNTSQDAAGHQTLSEVSREMEAITPAPIPDRTGTTGLPNGRKTKQRKKHRSLLNGLSMKNNKNDRPTGKSVRSSVPNLQHDTSYDAQSLASNKSRTSRRSSKSEKSKNSGNLFNCFVL